MKTFITFYGGGHAPMCIPVIRELERRGYTVTALALTVAKAYMERAGLSYQRPLDYVDFKAVEPYGRTLLKHHTEGKGLSIEESIAYLGVSLQNLGKEIGEKEAWAAYEKQGLNAFCPVAFMKEVLVRERPDIVITTAAPRMEMAALRAAHQLRIPSLCMVDLFALIEIDWLKRPDNGDVITVYNEKAKQRIISAGRNKDDIFITGNPAFDTLAPYLENNSIADAYRHAKGIPPEKKVVLWAEQPEPEDPTLPQRVRAHLHNVCQANGWQLVVRLHPSSTDASREVIPEGAGQSHAHEPLAEAIAAADVIATLTSTVGIEALLLDKPALIIAISPYQRFTDFTEQDGALLVDALDKAEYGLRTLLTDNPTSATLKKNRKNLPKVGQATGNVCDVVEYMYAGRRKESA